MLLYCWKLSIYTGNKAKEDDKLLKIFYAMIDFKYMYLEDPAENDIYTNIKHCTII